MPLCCLIPGHLASARRRLVEAVERVFLAFQRPDARWPAARASVTFCGLSRLPRPAASLWAAEQYRAVDRFGVNSVWQCWQVVIYSPYEHKMGRRFPSAPPCVRRRPFPQNDLTARGRTSLFVIRALTNWSFGRKSAGAACAIAAPVSRRCPRVSFLPPRAQKTPFTRAAVPGPLSLGGRVPRGAYAN